jgi:hypothetical protein
MLSSGIIIGRSAQHRTSLCRGTMVLGGRTWW